MKSKIISFFEKFFSKKTSNILINCFLILFILFPNFVIFSRTEAIVPFVVFVFLVLIFINWSSVNFLQNKKTIYIVTVFGFLLKLLIAIYFNKHMIQVSDFYGVFVRAKDFTFNTFYYQTAYHYLLYTFINGLAYKVFGAHQLVSFIINSLATTTAGVFLYLSAKRIFKKEDVANLTLVLFTFWPSLLLYNTILSPDHFALLFVCISIYLVCLVIDVILNNKVKQKWWLIVILGVCLSLLGFFKNFSPAILMAMLIIIALMAMKNKKIIISSLVTIAIVFATFIITNSMMFFIEERIVGDKILRNQFWQYAYVGLGLDNNGSYSPVRYGEFHDYLISHDLDIKKANAYFSKKLKKEIKENIASYPELIMSKTNKSFGNDSAPLGWIAASLNQYKADGAANKLIQSIVIPVNEMYYIILCMFVLIGAIYNILYLKNDKLLFVNIAIYGVCMLLLFVESQGRYKYAFEPLLCLLAVVGIYYGKDLIKRLMNNGSRKEVKK